MDPIDKAIRNALAKGDAEDPAFREKVYRSALAALDRAMQAQPGLTVEVAIMRRKSMQARIASIETEFQPALPPEEAAPPAEAPAPAPPPAAPRFGPAAAPFVDAPRRAPPPSQAPPVTRAVPAVEMPSGPSAVAVAPPVVATPEPQVDAPRRPNQNAGPSALDFAPGSEAPREPAADLSGAALRAPRGGLPGDRAAEVMPDRNERRVRAARGSIFGRLVALLVLAAILAGGWFAFSQGYIRLPDGLLADRPAAPPADGDATPPVVGEPRTERDWITVFSPDDASSVSAAAGAEAEMMQDESGSFLRIRSGAGGAPVAFQVGQGVLEQIAGKKVAFDILARAEEGKETQISVSCDFGALGDCGRRRYTVGYERGEYLFDVELPATRPAAAGTIMVNSDFANEGKAVDIYEIRVSTAQ